MKYIVFNVINKKSGETPGQILIKEDAITDTQNPDDFVYSYQRTEKVGEVEISGEDQFMEKYFRGVGI